MQFVRRDRAPGRPREGHTGAGKRAARRGSGESCGNGNREGFRVCGLNVARTIHAPVLDGMAAARRDGEGGPRIGNRRSAIQLIVRVRDAAAAGVAGAEGHLNGWHIVGANEGSAQTCRGDGRGQVDAYPLIRLGAEVVRFVLGEVVDVALLLPRDGKRAGVNVARADRSWVARTRIDRVVGLVDARCTAAARIGCVQRDDDRSVPPAACRSGGAVGDGDGGSRGVIAEWPVRPECGAPLIVPAFHLDGVAALARPARAAVQAVERKATPCCEGELRAAVEGVAGPAVGFALWVGRNGVPALRESSHAGSWVAAAPRVGEGPTNFLVGVVPGACGRAGEGERGVAVSGNQLPVDAPGQLQHVRRAPAGSQVVASTGAPCREAVRHRDVI